MKRLFIISILAFFMSALYVTTLSAQQLDPPTGLYITASNSLRWEDIGKRWNIYLRVDGEEYTEPAIKTWEYPSLPLEENLPQIFEKGGTYYFVVTATEKDGSNESEFSEEISLTITSVEDILLEDSEIIVFPNPASDQIRVDFTLIHDYSVEFVIIDLMGRPLMSETAFGTDFSVPMNIEQLQQGAYYLRMNIGGRQVVKPFIKQP